MTTSTTTSITSPPKTAQRWAVGEHRHEPEQREHAAERHARHEDRL